MPDELDDISSWSGATMTSVRMPNTSRGTRYDSGRSASSILRATYTRYASSGMSSPPRSLTPTPTLTTPGYCRRIDDASSYRSTSRCCRARMSKSSVISSGGRDQELAAGIRSHVRIDRRLATAVADGFGDAARRTEDLGVVIVRRGLEEAHAPPVVTHEEPDVRLHELRVQRAVAMAQSEANEHVCLLGQGCVSELSLLDLRPLLRRVLGAELVDDHGIDVEPEHARVGIVIVERRESAVRLEDAVARLEQRPEMAHDELPAVGWNGEIAPLVLDLRRPRDPHHAEADVDVERRDVQSPRA